MATRRCVSRPVAFWLVAYVFAATMLGVPIPTPLYVIYQARWHFSSGVITLIFATYAAGLLTALLLFGPVSDRIGRLPVLSAALAFSVASTVAFVAASNTDWLYVGRLLSGVSAGLMTGAGTAALTDLAAPGSLRRASIVATAVTTGGLGVGGVLSGTFAEYAPHPTVLVYEVHLAILALAFVALAAVPETVAHRSRVQLRFEGFRIPSPVSTFLAASVVGFASLALLGLFTALAPSLLADVLHVHNHAFAGVMLFLIFGASTLTQVALGTRSAVNTIRLGLAFYLAALALVVSALRWGSMTLFVLCAIVSGIAAGATFLGSLATANGIAPPGARGQVVSTYFTFAYIGLTIPVIAVGFSAEHIGYLSAVSICAACLGLLCIGALLRARRVEEAVRPSSPVTPPGKL